MHWAIKQGASDPEWVQWEAGMGLGRPGGGGAQQGVHGRLGPGAGVQVDWGRAARRRGAGKLGRR